MGATWSKAIGEKCAAHECCQRAVWHFEAGGVGSDYCDHHRDQIDDQLSDEGDWCDPEDDADYLDAQCGLHSDGQCSQAGTEHCDFICPNRNSDLFAGSEAWKQKHARKARG